MACSAAPVALRLWHDTTTRFGSKVAYAGICASAQHSADCHPSGHNSASTCGGQESPIDGKGYDPAYAHALDIHINDPSDGTCEAILAALLQDPRTRYCIWKGIGYYGIAHGFPGKFQSFDHTDHVHWSAMPGTTFDTKPFYGGAPAPTGGFGTMTDAEIRTEFANQDDRIVARVVKELYGTKTKPAGIAAMVDRNKNKLNRLLEHFGLKTSD